MLILDPHISNYMYVLLEDRSILYAVYSNNKIKAVSKKMKYKLSRVLKWVKSKCIYIFTTHLRIEALKFTDKNNVR